MPLLIILLFSSLSFATVTVENVNCPVQFEGRVVEKIESEGPSSFFETSTVVFKKLKSLKGSVSEKVFIEVLKHGPFSVEQGKDYRVQLRDGKLCWIRKI